MDPQTLTELLDVAVLDRLDRLAASRPHAARVTVRTGETEAAYADLVDAVRRLEATRRR